MLQVVVPRSAIMAGTDIVKKLIAADVQWIRLTGKFSEDELRPVTELSSEAGIILVLDDDVELVEKSRIHGVHLTDWDRGKVISVREELGPHAIVGVTCTDPGLLKDLNGLDVDYTVFPLPSDRNPGEYYHEVIDSLSKIKTELHPVASGCFSSDELHVILSEGVQGIEAASCITEAPDPEFAARHLLGLISNS